VNLKGGLTSVRAQEERKPGQKKKTRSPVTYGEGTYRDRGRFFQSRKKGRKINKETAGRKQKKNI